MNTEALLVAIRDEIKGVREELVRALQSRTIYDALLTKQQAAEYTKTSVRTIERWIAEGAVTPVKKPGSKRVVIRRDELDGVLHLSKEVL